MPNDNYDEAYVLLERSSLDPAIELDLSLLEDIQGNILKSHGRNYSIYLFLHFDNQQPTPIKHWIGNFAHKYVVSAARQEAQSQVYRKRRQANDLNLFPNLFVNFSLSFQGYQALGLDAQTNFRRLYQQKLDLIEKNLLSMHPFEEGMLKNLDTLKDRQSDWEEEYLQVNNEIHALILLADDDQDNLLEAANSIITEISAHENISIVNTEVGFVRRNDLNQTVEPFGFADGISQPLFLKQDIEKVTNIDQWNPSANLRLVLNVDPFGAKFTDQQGSKYSFGSFLVYRKLEQDVAGFNHGVTELARKLENKATDSPPKIETEQLVRAYSMGRFREDGRPVVMYANLDDPQASEIELNNFNYGEGSEFKTTSGSKCPFHAHIRKMTSRAVSNKVYSGTYKDSPENQRQRRIVRRGTSYGLPTPDSAALLSASTRTNLAHYQQLSEKLGIKLAAGKEGTLFFCFQSDIQAQFQKLQDYANDQNFGANSGGNLGADPIAGQSESAERPIQTCPSKWGDQNNPVEDSSLFGFVTARGGEYFFTPSLSFLKSFALTPSPSVLSR